MSESTNPIFTLLGWIHNIVYFYVRVLLPIVLSFCIGWTLIGMACNFGGSMGIAVPVFLIGIFIASYIIYGPKTFEYIKNRGTKPFDYNVDIEIKNELTPKTWTQKEI